MQPRAGCCGTAEAVLVDVAAGGATSTSACAIAALLLDADSTAAVAAPRAPAPARPRVSGAPARPLVIRNRLSDRSRGVG